MSLFGDIFGEDYLPQRYGSRKPPEMATSADARRYIAIDLFRAVDALRKYSEILGKHQSKGKRKT